MDALVNQPRRPVRVCVVDDDPVYRRILATTIEGIPGVELTGIAATLAEAKWRIESAPVDAVTIDLQLDNESGLDLLPWLAERHPRVVIVLITAGCAREARLAVDALLVGVCALVFKPAGPNARAILAGNLSQVLGSLRPSLPNPPPDAGRALLAEAKPREVIAIGASAGGPPVIVKFLKGLKAAFDVPLLLTQHMPAVHVPFFVELLERESGRAVRLAAAGEAIEAARVYVAGNDRHMRVGRASGRLVVVEAEGPPENQCRPAVDVLFRSVAETCGSNALGVVMTGMGVDGAAGALAMRKRGAPIIVQNEATSVVWGMPGATVAIGAATEIVSADGLAAAVQARTAGRLVRPPGDLS